MTSHHRLMVETVKKNPRILSSDFYNTYRRQARERRLNPKSARTFSSYVSELVELGYLKAERAKVRGNVRSFIATKTK